jgi:hypothetical protein
MIRLRRIREFRSQQSDHSSYFIMIPSRSKLFNNPLNLFPPNAIKIHQNYNNQQKKKKNHEEKKREQNLKSSIFPFLIKLISKIT